MYMQRVQEVLNLSKKVSWSTKVVKYKIYFGHQFNFTFNFYKSMTRINLKQHLMLDREPTVHEPRQRKALNKNFRGYSTKLGQRPILTKKGT